MGNPFMFKRINRLGVMKKKKSSHLVFKPNKMGQLKLPTYAKEMIPENHLAKNFMLA